LNCHNLSVRSRVLFLKVMIAQLKRNSHAFTKADSSYLKSHKPSVNITVKKCSNSYRSTVLLLEQLKYYHPSTTRSPKRFLVEGRQTWISLLNRHLNGPHHTCLACVNWSDRKIQRNENVTDSATDKNQIPKVTGFERLCVLGSLPVHCPQFLLCRMVART